MAFEKPDLQLHQEMVLLALKDDKGTPAAGMYPYALAGAILTELVLEERVRLEERKRGKPLVDLVSGTQIGDPVLDDALRQVRTAKRRAAADRWIGRWAKGKTMHEVARRLVLMGILKAKEQRVLLVFSRTVYPTMDPGPEQRLIERIRAALDSDDDVDPRTAAVITLAHAADLLKPIFGAKVLKEKKDRLKTLAEGDAVTEAAQAAINAAKAAVAIATGMGGAIGAAGA